MKPWQWFKPLLFAEAATPETEQGKALVDMEVATTQDGNDITRGYVDGLPLLQPEDSLLIGKLGGDLDGYRAVFSDPDVKIAWDQRSLGLIAREWYVEAGAEDRQSRRAADQLRETLAHLGWDEATRKMQLGVFFGRAVAECLWTRDGAMIALDNLKVRKAKRFAFKPDNALVMMTVRQPLGEPMPPRKFWRFSSGALDDDEPYGLGLAHWLYWPVWFRKNGEKFWSVFLEKFGMPTAIGKHPAGADQAEKDKLLKAIRAVHRDSGITISNNMMIELLEASRSGTANYEGFSDHWTRMIYRIIIGQDFSVTGAGGQYKGDNLMDVQRSIIKADADLINVSFARQVGAWLADWNFPGATPPRVWRRVEDAPDLEMLANTHSKLYPLGFRPTLDQVIESYGGNWEAAPATPAAAMDAIAGGGAPVNFAEGSTQVDAIDASVSRLGREGEPLIETGFINPLRAALDQALADGLTLAEFGEQLPALYAGMDASDLAELLGKAMFSADFGGRFDLNRGQ